MKQLLCATAIALLCSGAAYAQGGPSQAPHLASPTGTSSPPSDAFKNAGRPESHGGTVHAPQVGTTSGASTDNVRQLVESVARNTATAQQYGNLASMRHASGAAHELGDRMILTSSRINKALSAAYPELREAEQMSAQERGTFDNLARRSNETEFGVSLAQWVADNHPLAIGALERLGQNQQFKELAKTAVPELQAQLSDARRILDTARTSPTQIEAKPAAASGGAAPASRAKSD